MANVLAGVEHNVTNGLIRFLNWKMEGLTSGDRWRKYRRLVKRGRDIILPRLLYQFKDDEKEEWKYVFRTEHHGNIKYASVSGEHVMAFYVVKLAKYPLFRILSPGAVAVKEWPLRTARQLLPQLLFSLRRRLHQRSLSGRLDHCRKHQRR